MGPEAGNRNNSLLKWHEMPGSITYVLTDVETNCRQQWYCVHVAEDTALTDEYCHVSWSRILRLAQGPGKAWQIINRRKLQHLKCNADLHKKKCIFFESHKPQLQLSAESNCWLSASPNETELVNLAAPWFLSESRNRKEKYGKIKLSNKGRNRSKKGAKGCRHLLFLRPGWEYARYRWRNFRWRSFRWWNFRWRGVRWSVRNKRWVFGGIRLLNLFEECGTLLMSNWSTWPLSL